MIEPEKWWGVLESYNVAIFPIQIVMIALAAIATCLLFAKPGTKTNIVMKAFLALSFTWIALVFFLILGKELPAGYFQTSLFFIIAALFAIDIFRGKMEFRMPESGWLKYLTILLLIMVFSYPLIGMLFGHHYPRMVILGTFPCPTTAFALVLLVCALPRVDKILYVLLLIWAIPFPILIQIPQFGCYEDTIMLSIGIYGLIMLIVNMIRKK